MAYQALYRKWRPMDFDDVCGQGQIVSLLKEEVVTGRISHAYLLCGTRGTGKTTIAKVLAKAVNCTNPHDGNPCNECDNCKAVNSGSSIDVIEIDAASNNGVDNIRDIREQVMYAPASSKYKVYIIDEVHMLSASAFNALLKTLEEPPSHVIFILATTEFAKVPATILSRCQRFDFKKLPLEVIENRVKQVCDGENVTIEESACELVARLADGAMRDALSILDQCIGVSDTVTYEGVAALTGMGSREFLKDLMGAVIDGNYAEAIEVSEKLRETSKAYDTATGEILGFCRDLLLIKTLESYKELLNCTSGEIPMAQQLADRLTSGKIICYIDILQSEYDKIVKGGGKKTDFEILLYKLCNPTVSGNLTELMARVERLERAVASGVSVTVEAPVQKSVKSTVNQEVKKVSEPVQTLPKEVKTQPVAQKGMWNSIKAKLEPSVTATMGNTVVNEKNGGLEIQAEGLCYTLLTSSDSIVNQLKTIAKSEGFGDIEVNIIKKFKAPVKDMFDSLADNDKISFTD